MKATHFACVAVAVLVAGCASAPPTRQADICAVFDQHPDWYDYARGSAKKWGTPVHIQMAFVKHESSYRSDAGMMRTVYQAMRHATPTPISSGVRV